MAVTWELMSGSAAERLCKSSCSTQNPYPYLVLMISSLTVGRLPLVKMRPTNRAG